MSLDRSRLKFAKTHEWVHLEGNSAIIGISDFAVQALTDLVFMQARNSVLWPAVIEKANR